MRNFEGVGDSDGKDMSQEAPVVFDQLPQQKKLEKGNKVAGLNSAAFAASVTVAEIN